MEPPESRHRRGHVIVCGLRGIGLRIVEQFRLSDTDVVVLDDATGTMFDRQLATWGVAHVHANARVGDGLAEAGIEGAIAVVCVEAVEPELLDWLRARRIRTIAISYADSMQLGSNVVSLGADRVLVPASSRNLIAACRAEGLTVYDPDVSMISSGGGAVHCMCQALRRDSVA